MEKLGKIIFFIGIALAIGMGGIASYFVSAAYRLSPEEMSQTIWAFPSFWFMLWAFAVPLGATIAGTGILMNTKAKPKNILTFGIGTLVTLVLVSYFNGPIPHIPILFGIGGTLILLFYFLIIWKKSKQFKDNVFRLTAYTFLVMGFWFTCGTTSRPYHQAITGGTESPINIMIFFVLAMLFFWLSEKN